jgi:hypothetical protein
MTAEGTVGAPTCFKSNILLSKLYLNVEFKLYNSYLNCFV